LSRLLSALRLLFIHRRSSIQVLTLGLSFILRLGLSFRLTQGLTHTLPFILLLVI